MNRQNHQNHSVTLASPHIRTQLNRLDSVDTESMMIEITKAILFHTEESGLCQNLESAVVRLADGIDCTILRCGESGETNPETLFEKGQLSHIYGKAGIDAVEMSEELGLNRIKVEFVVDPNFIPSLGIYLSPSILEIARLKNGKLESLKPNFEPLFHITFRSA
jgi:hypothetical protein